MRARLSLPLGPRAPGELERVEFLQVLDALAHADPVDGQAQVVGDVDSDASLGRAVELGHDHAVEVEGIVELLCLCKAVLAGGRVDHEDHGHGQVLPRALAGHADDLLQLTHELGRGVQAAGGVDKGETGALALRRVEHVVADASRVAAALPGHDAHARALAPDLQLLDGGRAEGVGAADQAGHACFLGGPGDLAHRGRLARAVDAHEKHAAGQVRKGVALGHGELRRQAPRKRLLQLAGTFESFAGGLLAQVVGDLQGHLPTHVAHHEPVLEVLPEALVDLAAHVEDLGNRLTRAREALAQTVAEPHQASTTFPVALSRRWLTTWLTPSARIDTP